MDKGGEGKFFGANGIAEWVLLVSGTIIHRWYACTAFGNSGSKYWLPSPVVHEFNRNWDGSA
jgi:hypothetical protein